MYKNECVVELYNEVAPRRAEITTMLCLSIIVIGSKIHCSSSYCSDKSGLGNSIRLGTAKLWIIENVADSYFIRLQLQICGTIAFFLEYEYGTANLCCEYSYRQLQ